jgi:transposase-like protein
LVRRSAAEGRALVERWRSSGESVASFCRRAGVGEQVVRYWLARQTPGGERVDKPRDFYLVTAPQRSQQTEGLESAGEEVASASRRPSAFIVVVPAASPGVLARTVRELLAEMCS